MPSYGVRDYYDRQYVDYDGSHVTLTAQFAPSGFSFAPNSYIWVGQYKINPSISSDPDGFSMGGYRYVPDGSSRELLSIAFRDSTHTKLDLTKVPGQILTTLSTDGLYYEFDGANGRADIQSNFTSFTITSSVPEPETYAMLVAGLTGLGWCRRKSRS